MKLVIQRVLEARVSVNKEVVGEIEKGLFVLLGIKDTDDASLIQPLLHKLMNLRIFPDPQGKMNLSLKEVNAGLLIVSQFTLYGDCSKGNRPSFIKSAKGELAKTLYDQFVQAAKKELPQVATGRFGEEMMIHATNWGPTTLILEKSIELAKL